MVGTEDDAEIGDPKVDGAHRRREDAVVEQAAAGTEHQRERHQAEAVDVSAGAKASGAGRRFPRLQLVARLLLQRLHAGDDVAGHEAAAPGCSPRQRASASLIELDTTYLGNELIAEAMGLAGSVSR